MQTSYARHVKLETMVTKLLAISVTFVTYCVNYL